MTTTTLAEQIEAAVAAVDFGHATARRRGRNPRWPYVPVVDHGAHTEQIVKRAFETRGEAIYYAEQVLAARRVSLARRLADPRMRVLREQHGLPREIAS